MEGVDWEWSLMFFTRYQVVFGHFVNSSSKPYHAQQNSAKINNTEVEGRSQQNCVIRSTSYYYQSNDSYGLVTPAKIPIDWAEANVPGYSTPFILEDTEE